MNNRGLQGLVLGAALSWGGALREVLRWYFRRRRSEFYVRYQMFNQRLPEYLVSHAQRQIQNALNNRSDYTPWKGLADMILIWFGSPMGSQRSGYKVYQEGWQLFRIPSIMASALKTYLP